MQIDAITARVSLRSITPMTQSRDHREPKLPGESHDDYDIRTWRHKLHTEVRDGREIVTYPAFGVMMSLVEAAKYSKRQIPGQGKATWTAKFTSGIMLLEDVPIIGVAPADVREIVVSCNSDGVRGSGKRVPRRFPFIPAWTSEFDVMILDPVITKDVFAEMIDISGMFKGWGQYRPGLGGSNGRFKLTNLEWTDNRAGTVQVRSRAAPRN